MTFTNQKGGVGKTTLYVTFANYLVTRGVHVAVIDCDFQHPIVKCREMDIRKYGEEHTPYDMLSHEVSDKKIMTDLIEKLHNDPNVDVVLMDSPESLKTNGLIPMFVSSDVIIISFHYGLVTAFSTTSFLMFIDRLRKAVSGRMGVRLFIVLSLHDGRVSRRSELIIWDDARETFSNYGRVAVRIPKRADMERFNTMTAPDMQGGIVAPVFERIYTDISDTAMFIREVVLPSIRQTEKNDKKKSEARPITEDENEQ